MSYKNEEEFLAHYNPNEFDRPSVTTDILIVSISDEAQLIIVKVRRNL